MHLRDRGRQPGAAVLVLWLLVMLLPAAPAIAATGVMAFTVDSGIDSLVGSGKSLVFTDENATIQAFGGSSTEGVSMRATPVSGPIFGASVRPPTGQALVPGTYETTSLPTASTAGLDVSGDGIGCSSTGTMTVHEISYVADPDPRVERFAATYEQMCNANASEPVFGELRYDSTVDFAAATNAPWSLDFGNQYVGSTTAASPVTLTNAGTIDLTFGSAELIGEASGDFVIASDACSGETLTPGQGCVIEASFTASDIGGRLATIHLDDTTERGARDIRLIGTGFMDSTAVGLRSSRSTVRYGRSVVLTAHLAEFADTTNQTLEIHAKPYGGTYRLIASGEVDVDGDLSVTVKPKRTTTYRAAFAGDDHYRSSESPGKKVSVFADVTGSMVGGYGRSGNYRLYHYTSRCPSSGAGCPRYTLKVAPNHAGKYVCAFIQARPGGSWQTITSCVRLRLNAKSKASAIIVYGDTGVIGTPFRVRTMFNGDADHLEAVSDWAYFKITR